MRQQGPRQATRTRADLNNNMIINRTRGACDLGGQIEVEKEVLAQRFLGI